MDNDSDVSLPFPPNEPRRVVSDTYRAGLRIQHAVQFPVAVQHGGHSKDAGGPKADRAPRTATEEGAAETGPQDTTNDTVDRKGLAVKNGHDQGQADPEHGGITGGAAEAQGQRFASLSETTGRGNLTGQIMIKP